MRNLRCVPSEPPFPITTSRLHRGASRLSEKLLSSGELRPPFGRLRFGVRNFAAVTGENFGYDGAGERATMNLARHMPCAFFGGQQSPLCRRICPERIRRL